MVMAMKATRGARDDLLAIVGEAAASDAGAARRLLRRLRAGLRAVDDGSASGRVVPELGQAQIREVVAPPYRMLYADVDGRLYLLAIHASAHSSGRRV
jgi:plasmid stabilization system protein ParE